MRESIDTSNTGAYCWCQATEYKHRDFTTKNWSPFEKIYAKYIYVRNASTNCLSTCATLCSNVNSNSLLDGSYGNTVLGEILRATMFDSLLECMPSENKITYKNHTESVGYQYYDASESVQLKDAIEKVGYYFAGWCEDGEDCENPMTPGSTQTGWSGAKTLYAKWEPSGCDTGIKVNDDGTCTNECMPGFKEQFNPFSARWAIPMSDGSPINEVTYCNRTGGNSSVNGANWTADSSSSMGYNIKGQAYCSPTRPILGDILTDDACHNKLNPMFETIDTENHGDYCWCKATEFEATSIKAPLTLGKYMLDSKYVFAKTDTNCTPETCASRCAGYITKHPDILDPTPAFQGSDSMSLRVSIYRSPKKCVQDTYTLTFKDGDVIVAAINDYSVTGSVDLPTLDDKDDFTFAGWCEGSPNCGEPISGEINNVSGDKTFYAKWNAVSHDITYWDESKNILSIPGAPSTYSADAPVELSTMMIDENTMATKFFDESGNEVKLLQNQKSDIKLSIRTASYTAPSGGGSGSTGITPVLVDYTLPTTCDYGYKYSDYGILDSSRNTFTTLTSFISNSGNHSATTCDPDAEQYNPSVCPDRDWLPDIKIDNKELGVWGLLFADKVSGSTLTNPVYRVYGKSSCVSENGLTPPGALRYSESSQMDAKDGSGAYCWCKMTSFETKNGATPVSDTPWVYLKLFEPDSSVGNSTQTCLYNCAKECTNAMRTNQFFRSQVFGIYDVCPAETYTITYELNGGSWVDNPDVNQYTIVYGDVYIPTNVTRENYTFQGWCDDAELTQGCSKDRTIPTGSYGDKTFYAKWQGEEHTISFEHGTVNVGEDEDFEGGIDSQTVRYGDTNIELPENGFSVPGYHFDGWNCYYDDDNNERHNLEVGAGKDIVKVGDKYVISKYKYAKNITCEVSWAVTTYHIHYSIDFEFGNFNVTNLQSTFTIEDSPINIDAPQYDTNLLTFAGWCAGTFDKTSDTVVYGCEQNNLQKIYTILAGSYGDVYLQANFTPAEYNITYYKNNVSDSPLTPAEINAYDLPSKYPYGQTTTLTMLADEDGYKCIGWDVYSENNTLIADSVTKIEASNEDYTAPIKLVGHWEPITYHINYYLHKGDETVYETTDFTVETDEIILDTPDLEHFRFEGWYNFENDEPVTEIDPSSAKDWNLYAMWTRTSCENDYFLENKQCYPCSLYTSGLYLKADGTGAQSIEDCYAECPTDISNCPEHATCEYDYPNAESTTKDYYHTDETSGQKVPSCSFSFVCDTDNHYHENDDGTGCELDTYLVVYHKGNGNNDIINELKDTDFALHTYSVPLDLPTKDQLDDLYSNPHFDFVGWYDHPNPNIDTDTPVTEISATEIPANNGTEFNFYAGWETTDYHIEFYHGTAGERTNGFSGTMEFQTTVNVGDNPNDKINYNKSVKLKANDFAINGYYFENWSCVAKDDDGVEQTLTYNDGEEFDYKFNTDMVCTAQWNAHGYKLTYDCNGGTIATNQASVVSVSYDGPYSLEESICNPRDNYSITSWTCTPPIGEKWDIESDSTCVANWSETEYTITYKERNKSIIEGLTPTTYKVSNLSNETPLVVPTSNPNDKENATFKGWCVGLDDNCTDEQLVQNYTIPVPTGNASNLVLWAHWRETSCEQGFYLDGDNCKECPSPYTSDGGTGQCYYNWNCEDECPDNATCTSYGQTSGTIYYGSGDTYSCQMDVECKSGYEKHTSGTDVTCNPIIYHITYKDGNEHLGTGTFTIKDETIQLQSASKDGYIFDGWCVDAQSCVSSAMVKGTIAGSSWTIGNKILYAQWTKSEFECDSDKFLHIGDDTACLTATKQSSPALAIGKGNKKYYLKMTQKRDGSEGLKMNEASGKQLNILYKGNVYNVHDESVE